MPACQTETQDRNAAKSSKHIMEHAKDCQLHLVLSAHARGLRSRLVFCDLLDDITRGSSLRGMLETIPQIKRGGEMMQPGQNGAYFCVARS